VRGGEDRSSKERRRTRGRWSRGELEEKGERSRGQKWQERKEE
jgi:hypothetical protein